MYEIYNTDEFASYSNDYMIWSIVNVILFSPHIYLTLPNVFLSWLTRNYNMRSDFKSAKYYSKWSLISNIVIDILFILEIVTVVLLCVFLIPSSLSLTSSKILTTEQTSNLVDLIHMKKSTFQLLYQASRDGFDNKIFHSKCDGVGSTLTVIKSQNSNIFGGYTSADWSPFYFQIYFDEGLHKSDPTAFLFSLVNSYNISVKMDVSESESGRAIFAYTGYNIAFGGGYDLACSADQCSIRLFGYSFNLPSFLKYNSNASNSFLGGSPDSQIVEMEVYKVTN